MYTGNHNVGYKTVLDDVMQQRGMTLEELALQMGGDSSESQLNRLRALLTVHDVSPKRLETALRAAGATDDEVEKAVAVNKEITSWKNDFDTKSQEGLAEVVNNFWSKRDSEFAEEVNQRYENADALLQAYQQQKKKAKEKVAPKDDGVDLPELPSTENPFEE